MVEDPTLAGRFAVPFVGVWAVLGVPLIPLSVCGGPGSIHRQGGTRREAIRASPNRGGRSGRGQFRAWQPTTERGGQPRRLRPKRTSAQDR